MRMSTVFELLLIFLLIAFAAYARVIENNGAIPSRTVKSMDGSKQSNIGVTTISLKQATDNVNKYCTCNEDVCNCCRDFNIPLVQLKGPGCASLQYLQGDNLAVQLSFGDNVLTNSIVSGKKPKPVCVSLPGGFSQFCGRIYSIKREADRHFKACLGLELQSSTEIEASLRVSCFRFGPDGLKLRPPEPLPVVESDSSSDDYDDDDIFGLGSDSDDDEDNDDDDDNDEEEEEDEPAEANSVPEASSSDNDSSDDDDDDPLGLSALFDIFSDGDDDTTKKPKVTTPSPPQFTIPLLTKPTFQDTVVENEALTPEDNLPVASISPAVPDRIDVTTEAAANDVEAVDTTLSETSTVLDTSSDNNVMQAVASNNVEQVVEPDVASSNAVDKVGTWDKNKPISESVNAIKDDIKKPLIGPGKPDPAQNAPVGDNGDKDDDDDEEEEDDDEDEDDILGTADLDEDEDDEDEKEEEEAEEEEEEEDESEEDEEVDDNKKPSNSSNNVDNEKDETIVSAIDDDDDDDDDDDEEEDAVLSALVDDDDKEQAKDDKVLNNEAADQEEDDADYGFNLAEILARKRHSGRGRQSKVMRF